MHKIYSNLKGFSGFGFATSGCGYGNYNGDGDESESGCVGNGFGDGLNYGSSFGNGFGIGVCFYLEYSYTSDGDGTVHQFTLPIGESNVA